MLLHKRLLVTEIFQDFKFFFFFLASLIIVQMQKSASSSVYAFKSCRHHFKSMCLGHDCYTYFTNWEPKYLAVLLKVKHISGRIVVPEPHFKVKILASAVPV